MAKKTLVIVSGANGTLGRLYLQRFGSMDGFSCIGIVRQLDAARPFSGIGIQVDLLDQAQTAREIQNINLLEIKDIIFVHAVGKFKFEENGRPDLDRNHDGIDDEIYSSNVETFSNVVNPLLARLQREASDRNSIPISVCAFGSVSDKYEVPFWRSFSKAKNILKGILGEMVESSGGFVRGTFINVSSVNTYNENTLRPNADTSGWLQPEDVVEQSLPFILDYSVSWKEIDIFKSVPGFGPHYYRDLKRILKKWKKEMFRSETTQELRIGRK
jgi:NAD(P)-dependent dehydrogenase (short-subunit alcohol dehydrogenase family)